MFTGIVEHVGVVRTLAPVSGGGARLTLDLGPLAARTALGDSVAIDGCCLTLSELHGALGGFDAVPETLERTTLGQLLPGARVNLETALLPTRPLGGHFVQGHVDGLGTVIQTVRGPRWAEWHIQLENEALAEQIVEKGSVALNGISLTVGGCDRDAGTFWVALIPETLARTNIAEKGDGARVNVETDILGKYVLAALKRHAPVRSAAPARITEDFLRENGY